MSAWWDSLREARYALPTQIERIVPGPDEAAALRLGARLGRAGCAVTYGQFPATTAAPADNLAANLALAKALRGAGQDAYLSVKAPPLEFDPARIAALAQTGVAMVMDAHTPAQADAIHGLIDAFPGAGAVLPARWARSVRDADRLSDVRLRLVKGEWADPAGDVAEPGAAFLSLARHVAGRRAVVGVATHDPALARGALEALLTAGTPCELEQLRGLPRRRTMAVARELGVPVRIYVPFGPGWWPYAVDKALARPYLAPWWLRDRLGIADRPSAD